MENYSFINTYRKGVYFTNLLAAALIFIFSGCKNPSSESWEEPVRDYFEKYTNTAAIEKHEIDSEITKDNLEQSAFQATVTKP